MLAKGHLHVRFFGKKMVGDWHLLLTARDRPGARAASLDDGAGGQGKSSWLMFKAKDRHANAAYDVVVERPESVVSGRQGTRGPRRVGASQKGVKGASPRAPPAGNFTSLPFGKAPLTPSATFSATTW